jgi:hypothetical protein
VYGAGRIESCRLAPQLSALAVGREAQASRVHTVHAKLIVVTHGEPRPPGHDKRATYRTQRVRYPAMQHMRLDTRDVI